MRHAKLSKSSRLQRVLKALQEAHGELSTREIIGAANVCAVNSCIAELRENGAEITCRQEVRDGQRVFFYTLVKSPGAKNA